jgi:hypothetical protein
VRFELVLTADFFGQSYVACAGCRMCIVREACVIRRDLVSFSSALLGEFQMGLQAQSAWTLVAEPVHR